MQNKSEQNKKNGLENKLRKKILLIPLAVISVVFEWKGFLSSLSWRIAFFIHDYCFQNMRERTREIRGI